MTARGAGRQWSWAPSPVEADARRREAAGLVGQRIRAVRYFTLDYRRDELHPGLVDSGPRRIDAEPERSRPTWRFQGFDAVDFGFEVVTDSEVFSLTWDPPGMREGIGLQPVPMLGSGVRSDADVAIWDVGERSEGWRPMIGRRVTGVDLRYVPWDEPDGSLYCARITISGDHVNVEALLADARDGAMVPSADTVAVLHPRTPLPPWWQ